ncbi:hypothetical protein Tco_0777399, partial [Tanacetum coccineum]
FPRFAVTKERPTILLKSTDEESIDKCVSCLSGMMTRKPFPYRTERATDLLGLIHTDVCGPLRHQLTSSDTLVSKEESYLVGHGSINDESYNSAVILLGLCSRVCYTHSQYGSNQEGYLKETMGYYFYFPPENKIVVARYVEFLDKNLISQKASGMTVELKEIQNEDTSPFENTSEIPMEVEGFKPPQEEVVPVRRSARIHRDPKRLYLNVLVAEHILGDLNRPTNYKAALLDPESDKWLDAMND